MSLDSCKIMSLPRILDARGNLTFLEGCRHIPFDIKRIFYLYDVPTGKRRGAHAHKSLHQFLICLNGCLDVIVDDGENSKMVHLNKPWIGLHIPPMIWAEEANFSLGSVCLVMASDFYNETDYIRNYSDFINIVNEKSI